MPHSTSTPCRAGLTRLERQLPSIAAAATRAAERACAGGRVWALSDEEGFVSELQHRASGLMMVRGIPGGETFELDDGVSPEDTVIAATQDNATERQGSLLDGLAERGVAVTLIGCADSPLRTKAAAFIDTGLPAGNAPVLPYGDATICPLASALNISAGWLWCIELANACAALGREPVFLMSGGLATGLDRNAQHEGKAFHDPGEYTIVPSPAGQKGSRAVVRVAPLPGRHPRDRAGQDRRDRRRRRLHPRRRTRGVVCIHRPQPVRPARTDRRPRILPADLPRAGRDGRPPGRRLSSYTTATTPSRTTSCPPLARPSSGRHGSWAAGRSRPSTPMPARSTSTPTGATATPASPCRGTTCASCRPSGVITTAMLWLLHAAAADHIPA